MAEFQWWLLLVGLVAGGGLVAIVSADFRRREEDLADLERDAEATWIAERLTRRDREIDAHTVESVLRVHREYLSMPPPDRLAVDGGTVGPADGEGEPTDGPAGPTGGAGLRDRDADRDPDDVRDDRGGGSDQDLSNA